MPILKDGTYRLPAPYKSTDHAGWEVQKIRQTDGSGGIETTAQTVERTVKPLGD